MKKLFTILALTTFVFVSNAQKVTKTVTKEVETVATMDSSDYKPNKGTITAEAGLTGGLNNANFALNEGAFRLRYFIKSDLAVRLGVAIGSSNTESSTVAIAPATITTTTTTKTGSKTFNLGIEKHFAGSDRLSTYVGADLLIGFNSASVANATSDGTFSNLEGAAGFESFAPFAPKNRAGSSFGFRIVTGADYYIAKKVYLGVEAGLGYRSGTSDAISTSVKSTPTGATTDTTLNSEGKLSGAFTSIVGGVRIGYQF